MKGSSGPCMLLVVLVGLSSALAAGESMFIGPLHPPPSMGKIVGGTAANITAYPYQLSLMVNNSHICGASLINTTWAMTAAHCVDNPASTMTVRAGSSVLGVGGTVRSVLAKYVHPQWNRTYIDYDLALLKLSTPYVLSTTIKVIRLHDVNATVANGTAATISGWGQIMYGSCLPNDLQTITVPVVDTPTCQTIWNAGNMIITPRMICAGGLPSGGKGSCLGDSGGPMTIQYNATTKVQVGVVSWVYPCANPKVPDVYARVANMRAWIKTVSGT